MLMDGGICGDRNVVKKGAEKILKYKDRIKNSNSAHVEYETKSDTGNNRRDWNHIRITRNIPVQRTGKALHNAAILGTAHILWKVLM
jgi:hypothetical protein